MGQGIPTIVIMDPSVIDVQYYYIRSEGEHRCVVEQRSVYMDLSTRSCILL